MQTSIKKATSAFHPQCTFGIRKRQGESGLIKKRSLISKRSFFLSNQSGVISCLIFFLPISFSVLRFSLVLSMPPQFILCSKWSHGTPYRWHSSFSSLFILFTLHSLHSSSPTFEVVSHRYFSGSQLIEEGGKMCGCSYMKSEMLCNLLCG